jgi:predicted kinase
MGSDAQVTALILVNGPPGAGKSSVARMYVAEHPLTLNLDLDRIRDLIGQWRENAHDAGVLTRRIAIAGARVHLNEGHDVIVPQMLARPEFIAQLEDLAREVAVNFVEVVLLDTRENCLRRYTERGDLQTPRDQLEAMYDRLVALVPTRPGATVIPVRGDAAQTYGDVMATLGRR